VNILEYEKLAKKNRKKPIIDYSSASQISVNYGKQEIKKLIPHREKILPVFYDILVFWGHLT
jgi:hypothetical protein